MEKALQIEKDGALEDSVAIVKLKNEEKKLIVAKGYEETAARQQCIPVVPSDADAQEQQEWDSSVAAFIQKQKDELQAYASQRLIVAAGITAKATARASGGASPQNGTPGGSTQSDQHMQQAPDLPQEIPNKHRKSNQGAPTPADPGALSEQQQQDELEQQAIKEEAAQALANLLQATAVEVSDNL